MVLEVTLKLTIRCINHVVMKVNVKNLFLSSTIMLGNIIRHNLNLFVYVSKSLEGEPHQDNA